MADSTQFHQLLMNLFSNAIHAMDEKGTIKVSVSTVQLGPDDMSHKSGLNPGLFLTIKVSDTGMGMNKETQEKIFDPFYTTKEVDEGTGMGLSIVLGIVKSHNGFVEVDSEPGKGTIFTLYFPALGDAQVLKIEETTEEYLRGNERILFVDDEELLAEMGSRMLGRQGYQVTISTSSKGALETFKSNPEAFDLVITDQTMPNMSGSELSSELLNIRPEIPIIICTGYSKMITEGTAKEMGIREFCVKPLDRKDFARVVRKVLDDTSHSNS